MAAYSVAAKSLSASNGSVHRCCLLAYALQCFTLLVGNTFAADPAADQAESAPKPIRALLITGGCCHDYEKQKVILSEGISARAPVEWTIIHEGGSATNVKIPFYENENWAAGYDVVVHNECFAEVTDPTWTERILKPHREGLPAVVIHCAMHCYRDKTDEWFKFIGLTSRGHGSHFPFEIVNLQENDPIMQGFGKSWKTPKGELYQIESLGEHCTPLGHAYSHETKKHETCIWKNQFGKARVFGTTVGHYNEEMSEPAFLDYVTRGLLWSVDRLDDTHFHKAQALAKPTQGPKNLALGGDASASSVEDDSRAALCAFDNRLDTRWCASSPDAKQWLKVDLKEPADLSGVRITWEGGGDYRYRVEVSADGSKWEEKVDATGGGGSGQTREHKFEATGVRSVRINTTALPDGAWASIFELEVLSKKLFKLEPTPAGIGAIPNKMLLAGIKAPPGFNVTLFAAPPNVSYPTCLAVTANGDVFVGVDENGSIDNKAGRGKVVRCIDDNNDGTADRFETFAEMDSPRGVFYEPGTLYVLHPPQLTAYHDDNNDGKSDRQEVLVDGIGFDLKNRGADHTTNGFRLGIDGRFYIAVGDYGFVKAKGKDGGEVQMFGGGVVSVRTDGSGLEVVSRGQRNIYDVAVDPFMNMFTRDNTNDGGGWDVRLSHVVNLGHYGYPMLFANFPEEILQPLAIYGGGSPTGSLYVNEAALPAPFGDTLYTCDWGRSIVYRHPLTAKGASFEAGEETFLEIPRPTDIDVDAAGRMFVSSWKDGGFTYSGPNVGFIVRVAPDQSKAPEQIDSAKLSDDALVAQLGSGSHSRRIEAQRALLKKSIDTAARDKIFAACVDTKAPLAPRVASLYTLALSEQNTTVEQLAGLMRIGDLREHVLRAASDNLQLNADFLGPVVRRSLLDADPRVNLQALLAFSRLGKRRHGSALLAVLENKDPVVAHVAERTIMALPNAYTLFDGLDVKPASESLGMLRSLAGTHDPAIVDNLMTFAAAAEWDADKQAGLTALCRLARREAEWKGQWWGTRPDTHGPYYYTVRWEQSDRIDAFLTNTLDAAQPEQAAWLAQQLVKQRVDLPGLSDRMLKLAEKHPDQRSAAASYFARGGALNDNAIAFLGAALQDAKLGMEHRVSSARLLQTQLDRDDAYQALFAGLATLGRDDFSSDLGKLREELARDIHSARHVSQLAKDIANGDGRRDLALLCLALLTENSSAPPDAWQAAVSVVEQAWRNPAYTASLLWAVGRGQCERYGKQVELCLKDDRAEIREAAGEVAKKLRLSEPGGKRQTVAELAADDAVAAAVTKVGDRELGARLFTRQGCVNCHAVQKGEPLKGPFLGGIGVRYSRKELCESVVKPSAKIAQGFETQYFLLEDGRVLDGFVVRESGDKIEYRNAKGEAGELNKAEIEERGRRETSIMPTGLADQLSLQELASILSYLESLPSN